MTILEKFSVVLFAMVFGQSTLMASVSPEKEREIAAAVSGLLSNSRKVEHIDIYQHPKRPDVYAILLDDNWWFKSLRIVEFKGGALVWTAELPTSTQWGDNAVLSASWRVLPKIGITILEVYTSTHRGNGEYSVFELRGQKLERLLAVRSIGSLEADYGNTNVKINRLGNVRKENHFEEIEIEGEAKFLKGDPAKVIKTENLYQLFQWNPEKKGFEEVPDKRKGTPKFLFI